MSSDQTDHLNILGALIFWLYIVAALLCTSVAVSTIACLPTAASGPSSSHAKHYTRLFASLALLSFAVLSFNMLHVLVHSFRLWSLHHAIRPFSNLSSILDNVYHWSTTSTLFYDFAAAIVGSHARCLWTQSALFMTLFQCWDIAMYGHAYRIPNLWALVALSQILPISFAQNLLYLAVVRSGSPTRRQFVEKGQDTAAVNQSRIPYWGAALFACVLLTAPLAASDDQQRSSEASRNLVLLTILSIRLLLLPPFFIAKSKGAARDLTGGIDMGQIIWWHASAASALRLGRLIIDREAVGDIGLALLVHPAVTTLGVDLMISAASLGIWKRVKPDMDSR